MTNASLRRARVAGLAIVLAAGSSQSSNNATLQAGMTRDQTVATMGQPDLKDNVPDPNHSGANVLRYTWLGAGKTAVFTSDNHVASIENIGSTPSTITETAQAEQPPPSNFDPIETPLNYAFYTFKAARIHLCAPIN